MRYLVCIKPTSTLLAGKTYLCHIPFPFKQISVINEQGKTIRVSKDRFVDPKEYNERDLVWITAKNEHIKIRHLPQDHLENIYEMLTRWKRFDRQQHFLRKEKQRGIVSRFLIPIKNELKRRKSREQQIEQNYHV